VKQQDHSQSRNSMIVWQSGRANTHVSLFQQAQMSTKTHSQDHTVQYGHEKRKLL